MKPALLLGLLLAAHASAAPIPDDRAVRAIIGEAANQGPRGMLAVAGALRNRGTLTGVYGEQARFIATEPAWVWQAARAAWAASKTNDITQGATHWENIQAYGTPAWARAMKRTVRVGDHQFFKP